MYVFGKVFVYVMIVYIISIQVVRIHKIDIRAAIRKRHLVTSFIIAGLFLITGIIVADNWIILCPFIGLSFIFVIHPFGNGLGKGAYYYTGSVSGIGGIVSRPQSYKKVRKVLIRQDKYQVTLIFVHGAFTNKQVFKRDSMPKIITLLNKNRLLLDTLSE